MKLLVCRLLTRDLPYPTRTVTKKLPNLCVSLYASKYFYEKRPKTQRIQNVLYCAYVVLFVACSVPKTLFNQKKYRVFPIDGVYIIR